MSDESENGISNNIMPSRMSINLSHIVVIKAFHDDGRESVFTIFVCMFPQGRTVNVVISAILSLGKVIEKISDLDLGLRLLGYCIAVFCSKFRKKLLGNFRNIFGRQCEVLIVCFILKLILTF